MTDQDQSRALLPCPFCGEVPILKPGENVTFIVCPEDSTCADYGLAIGFENGDERAIEAWNRRAALNHKAAEVELPEPVAWILGCQTMGGDVGWKLSFSQSGAGVCHRLKGEQFEQPLYTEQAVRTLLATAPSVPQGWMPVGERLPEPGTPVLLDIGKKHPIRAMWAAKFTLEVADCDPGLGEYDVETGEYYCPEGWYEWNEHEECHWSVSAKPISWIPLPQPPKEQT